MSLQPITGLVAGAGTRRRDGEKVRAVTAFGARRKAANSPQQRLKLGLCLAYNSLRLLPVPTNPPLARIRSETRPAPSLTWYSLRMTASRAAHKLITLGHGLKVVGASPCAAYRRRVCPKAFDRGRIAVPVEESWLPNEKAAIELTA
jgi:hypothetical protein